MNIDNTTATIKLRDWFAGQTLAGMDDDEGKNEDANCKVYARYAYKMADAMLDEKSRTEDHGDMPDEAERPMLVADHLRAIGDALNSDKEYAKTVIEGLALMAYNAGADYKKATEQAVYYMQRAFGYKPPKTDKTNSQAQIVIDEMMATIRRLQADE